MRFSDEIVNCGNCGSPPRSNSLKVCVKCKRVAYCDGECQKEAWRKGHSEKCSTEERAVSIQFAQSDLLRPSEEPGFHEAKYYEIPEEVRENPDYAAMLNVIEKFDVKVFAIDEKELGSETLLMLQQPGAEPIGCTGSGGVVLVNFEKDGFARAFASLRGTNQWHAMALAMNCLHFPVIDRSKIVFPKPPPPQPQPLPPPPPDEEQPAEGSWCSIQASFAKK